MSQSPTAAPAADPFQMWRDWLNQSERQWNSFFNEMMATDQYSQAMGRFMDVYLNMQKSMNDVMGRFFQTVNVPTRTDVLTLGNRLGEIEDRLIRMEQLLRDANRAAPAEAPALSAATSAPARPRRTRKPPSD